MKSPWPEPGGYLRFAAPSRSGAPAPPMRSTRVAWPGPRIPLRSPEQPSLGDRPGAPGRVQAIRRRLGELFEPSGSAGEPFTRGDSGGLSGLGDLLPQSSTHLCGDQYRRLRDRAPQRRPPSLDTHRPLCRPRRRAAADIDLLAEYWWLYRTDFLPRAYIVGGDGEPHLLANTDTEDISAFSRPITATIRPTGSGPSATQHPADGGNALRDVQLRAETPPCAGERYDPADTSRSASWRRRRRSFTRGVLARHRTFPRFKRGDHAKAPSDGRSFHETLEAFLHAEGVCRSCLRSPPGRRIPAVGILRN